MKPDYYAILEIKKEASQDEIKAAFRRLAMILHPDKNPDDPDTDEKFMRVMEAYDVLGDPVKKKKYDSGRSYHSKFSKHTTHFKTTKGKQKDYSFTDDDLRKRQYFGQHYKKYQQRKRPAEKEPEIASYSDLKYIMISIPLAIALLFFTINSYKKDDKKHLDKAKYELAFLKNESSESFSTGNSLPEKTMTENESNLAINVSPWSKIFGKPVSDSVSKAVLRLENKSGCDVVVCLFDIKKRKVIRNNFITDNYNFVMENIPKGNYYLKIVYGKNWNTELGTTEFSYYGTFDPVLLYAKMKEKRDQLIITDNNTAQGDTVVRTFNSYKDVPVAWRTTNYDFFWK
ncbi:MAG: J domain-containing protein [Bacteroidia bacterium]|nr:J domain-containing protein [Bacteroidia bacterium]